MTLPSGEGLDRHEVSVSEAGHGWRPHLGETTKRPSAVAASANRSSYVIMVLASIAMAVAR
jgi:hypothetical protein